MNRNVDLSELSNLQGEMVTFGESIQDYSGQMENGVTEAEVIMKDPPSREYMEKVREIAKRLNQSGCQLAQEAQTELDQTKREIDIFEAL